MLATCGLVTFTALTVTLLVMGVNPTLIGPLILAIVVGVNHLLQSITTSSRDVSQSEGSSASRKALREETEQQEAQIPGHPRTTHGVVRSEPEGPGIPEDSRIGPCNAQDGLPHHTPPER
ncbi:hypothetical protein M2163_001180 [Streptomyces sp. SAI-135]|jgi:hypothetical protein|nr:hypothetical protein [Streptomyces sp. SAI-090]MDH6554116.1 hypothetical protein [Streptomyces sp. SAI-041]MDH6573193.1 hypothetical protein [Streptomyces sp. SAI-117]MDH6614072.1 hypothetical protein [Streptomyces sp. SAI-135]